MSSFLIYSATIFNGTIGGVMRGAAIRCSGGRITHLDFDDQWKNWPDVDEVIDAKGAPVCPGFIDIHHHGGGGFAYDDGPDAFETAMQTHRAHGTTRCVASFVTDDFDTMLERISGAAQLVKHNPHLLGLHPEGPFLDPGHKGAHPEAELKDPTQEAVGELIKAGRGTIVQVTIAPEKPHGMEAVKFLAGRGVKAAVGHTNATFEQAREAFDQGARILTHAFNAMNSIHHRAPGPVIAALRDERCWIEVINDGIHVHPDVVKMLFLEAPERLILVTDAMAATGQPDGDYMLGQLEVVVKDGQARLKEGGSLAGSTLTMDKAVANAVLSVHIAPDLAIAAATTHPAKALGVESEYGRLDIGYPDDVLILDPVTWLPTAIFTDGKRVEPAATA